LKRGTKSADFVKIAQGIRPCGAFIFHISHFDQMSVKFQFLGSYTLIIAPMGVEFGTCQNSPHRCNMSPLRGEKPQNRPMSKLNNQRFALRAMLPLKN